MAETGIKQEHVALAEVPYDDDEIALVHAETQPAVDDDPAKEVDLVLAGDKTEAQMNGVMVLSLLDKIIGVVDQIQHTQNGLEARQEAMEKTVSSIQGELAKLTKNHTGTANTVNKMLDKVRKVSVNVKTVRSNLEKQAGQIKKLENNENELLKRRNFKVLIYQVTWGDVKGSDVCICSVITIMCWPPKHYNTALKFDLVINMNVLRSLGWYTFIMSSRGVSHSSHHKES